MEAHIQTFRLRRPQEPETRRIQKRLLRLTEPLMVARRHEPSPAVAEALVSQYAPAAAQTGQLTLERVAIMLEKYSRMIVARNKFLRALKAQAVISAAARGKRERIKFKKKRSSIVKIQANQRGHQSRRKQKLNAWQKIARVRVGRVGRVGLPLQSSLLPSHGSLSSPPAALSRACTPLTSPVCMRLLPLSLACRAPSSLTYDACRTRSTACSARSALTTFR